MSGTDQFAGTMYGGCIYRSTDKGTSWGRADSTLASTNVNSNSFSSFAVSGTNLFAGIGNGVFLTTDKGTNWNDVSSGIWSINSLPNLAENGMYLFAGCDDGVFLSTDNGKSWAASGLTNRSVLAFAVLPPTGATSVSNLFAGTWGLDGGVFRSTDNGTSWTDVSSGLPHRKVNCLVASNASLFANTDGGVFLTRNNGKTWNDANLGLTGRPVTKLAFIGTNLFAGTCYDGVFLSIDSGLTWSKVNTGLTNMYVDAFAFDGSDVFVGTGGSGVWRRPLSEMVVEAEHDPVRIPDSFLLGQNFPNPFNPSTSIRYSLPSGQHVRIIVYTVLGQEVAVLADEDQTAGYKQVTFDASGFPSGVYLYRLQARTFVETKKMVLMR
jgi:photosystem II stability/assembly factor-like uncharacterized protein